MTSATLDVRLDAAGQDRLGIVIERLQAASPELSIDDCIDAIFSIGLIDTYSHLTILEALKGGAA